MRAPPPAYISFQPPPPAATKRPSDGAAAPMPPAKRPAAAANPFAALEAEEDDDEGEEDVGEPAVAAPPAGCQARRTVVLDHSTSAKWTSHSLRDLMINLEEPLKSGSAVLALRFRMSKFKMFFQAHVLEGALQKDRDCLAEKETHFSAFIEFRMYTIYTYASFTHFCTAPNSASQYSFGNARARARARERERERRAESAGVRDGAATSPHRRLRRDAREPLPRLAQPPRLDPRGCPTTSWACRPPRSFSLR